ncbi:MAG: carbohydrate-binding family 9-like protein, partial [Armatimonadetes bacterium]|nr:carbohydrate-binding family 9-like protein [Armatimonadota bacterium]
AGVGGELFVVHFWPQRTSWKTREYYITPELLLPYEAEAGRAWFPEQRVLVQKPYDLKAGTTGAIWVRIRVEPSATAGDYDFRLRIKASGREALSVPLRLTVLPFRLRKPDEHRWLLYGDVWRWRAMSDEQRWIDARDIAAHGIDGIVEMPLGTADLAGLKDGTVKWDVSQTRRYLELFQQAGLRGPWVMSGGVADAVRKALGIEADLHKAAWPEEVCRGVQTAARLVSEIYRSLGVEWYFYGWDEPHAENIYAIEDYKNWHLGGARVYVTMYEPSFWEAIAEYLDAPCFSVGMIGSEQGCEQIRAACERHGKQFWWYGSGCYTGQEGRMFANRYLAGYLFWKTGARCQVSWTFCRVHEDPFNDFDGVQANSAEPKEQCTVYPWWEKPDWSTYRGPIQTVQWEALREGIDDFCYMWTLLDEANRAASAPSRARARAGRQAKRALRDIEALLPWLPDVGRAGFTNAECQAVRQLVADQILALLEERRAGPGAQPETLPVNVRVVVRPGSEAAARSLPVTAIPRAPVAPVINGHLDDAAWQSAAALPVDRDTNSGEPVSPPATALAVYDDNALYVAFKCVEPLMSGLVAKRTGRDPHEIWTDDSVELFVDPTDTRKKYAHFIVNAAGALYDELNQDAKWDSSAVVAAARFGDAWAVEIAVPWADLQRAGIPRSATAAIALNFCRNRYADPKSKWRHAVWSVPYGGFHVPSRFGIGILETGDVGLVGLETPRLLGPGTVKLTLRNRSSRDAAVKATALLLNEDGQAVGAPSASEAKIPPEATATLSLPVAIGSPGRQTLRVSYSVEPSPPVVMSLLLDIAAPASLGGGFLAVGESRTLRVPLDLNLAPDGRTYTFTFRVWAAGHEYWRSRLECHPGSAHSMEARALLPKQACWLDITLTGPDGKELWETRAPVMPAFNPLS